MNLRWASPLIVVVLAATACSSSTGASSRPATTTNGVLDVAVGSCTGAQPTGSWFRMVQSGGSAGNGPYVTNGDSPCTDKTVTPLAPGTDGGLRVGDYQPQPNPSFGKDGASLAAAVIRPADFFAVPFGISTNATDPQTGRSVPVPTITISGSKLTADLSAVSVSWNGQYFNQGAPKPGASGGATGTYNPVTKQYTLGWTSAIKGGPFNGFIGIWHLEGSFQSSS